MKQLFRSKSASAENKPYPFLKPGDFSDHLNMHARGYNDAAPFPHAVIDNFLPPTIAHATCSLFPDASLPSFEQPDNQFQRNKLGRTQVNGFEGVPEFIRHLLYDFNNQVFVNFLEKLTGIEGLIVDPHFHGGALHQILPGGKLAIHSDFNREKRLKLDRRLNVLIYFNKDWPETFGGHLELWDTQMQGCVKRVLPIFNRCVVFNTTSNSFHGHPEPLTCPTGRSRNSIALYYYTNGRPEAEVNPAHSTLWQERPGQGY